MSLDDYGRDHGCTLKGFIFDITGNKSDQNLNFKVLLLQEGRKVFFKCCLYISGSGSNQMSSFGTSSLVSHSLRPYKNNHWYISSELLFASKQ